MTRGGCLQQDSLACRIEKVCAKDGNGWSKLKPSCPLPWAHRSHQSLAGITAHLIYLLGARLAVVGKRQIDLVDSPCHRLYLMKSERLCASRPQHLRGQAVAAGSPGRR